MGVCGMRNSPLVRTALFRHFKRSEISLRWIPEQNQMLRLRQLFFCQAKEGEHQRSTPPQEPPIGRAASIRTCPLSRKRLGPDAAISELWRAPGMNGSRGSNFLHTYGASGRDPIFRQIFSFEVVTSRMPCGLLATLRG